MNPFGQQFSPEEEEEFGDMARSENFYEKFAASVAPSIYGSMGNSISQPHTLASAHMFFFFVAAQTSRRRSPVCYSGDLESNSLTG